MLTSTLDALLSDLEALGIKLSVANENLRYSAPPGALTQHIRSQLKDHKAELIALLRDRELATAADSRQRTFPASFAQRFFWTNQNQNPQVGYYNDPFLFRLQGPLDLAILRRSLDAIVSRHEILRTTLQEEDGQLTQIVAPAAQTDLTFRDLRECPGPERRAEIERALRNGMERAFDLACETGLRVLLLQVDEEEYLLLFCFHNTIFDLNSLLVLLKELSQHYSAFLEGQDVSLPAPAQYSEYVSWQDKFKSSRMPERMGYWQEWFRHGEPPQSDWKPHKVRPEIPSFHTHMPRPRSSPELTSRLKELSRSNGVTLYLTLIAAFALILRRFTGDFDVTLGTTYSNRNHWKFASLIGATIDVPALRIDTGGNPTVAALLSQTRAVVAAALTNQDIPWGLMAQRLEPPRKTNKPLFRAVFSFFPETAHGKLQLPGLEVTFLEDRVNELSRPDLYLVLWENKVPHGEELGGYWMHKKDAFVLQTSEQMHTDWNLLLAAMVEKPESHVDDLLAALDEEVAIGRPLATGNSA